MRRIIKIISACLLLIISFSGCSDFEEINTRPDAFTSDEVSAKYFLTGIQIELYAPNRYPYWRAQLIHADRFAGHFTFGFDASWWAGNLGYDYNSGYTDAAYDWIAGYVSKLSVYQNFVGEGGDLENEKYYAIGLIMKGLYYQMYTDAFGMVPYTEASNPDIITPKFDTQEEIYRGVIADLDRAMELIGDATVTGEGVELLAENDLFFNGDLQKWKKLANTLKLRMALRAEDAGGADWAAEILTEALTAPLLMTAEENALLEKDTNIDQWANAAYGDVWHNFGGEGSKWNVAEPLIDYLRDTNDPRLSKYAQPIKPGTYVFEKPAQGTGVALFEKFVNFVLGKLDEAGVDYQRTDAGSTVTIVVPEGVDYYVGQPIRLSPEIKTHIKNGLFSDPAEWITNPKNQGLPIFPEIVMTSAEGNFLKAEAIVKGYATGDAQAFYQAGLIQAMKLWEVNDEEIAEYLATQEMALLNGTPEENFEKIAIQRWIAAYTDGFEAWAIVRDTGYPKELANGVTDFDIYSAGTLNGEFPQRLQYGNAEYNTNSANLEAALQVMGPDEQGTNLWWAIGN